MEQRIKQLIKRLSFLGYCTFEIKNIINQVTDNNDFNGLDCLQGAQVIGHLEMYERLGLKYLQNYSK